MESPPLATRPLARGPQAHTEPMTGASPSSILSTIGAFGNPGPVRDPKTLPEYQSICIAATDLLPQRMRSSLGHASARNSRRVPTPEDRVKVFVTGGAGGIG